MKKPETGTRVPAHGAVKDHHSKEEERESREARERRERFARALARAAFGRFYWDERQDAELRRTLGRKTARRKPPRPKPR